MSYVKTINEDGVVSDIMAVALEATLDATLVHTADVTQATDVTTAGKVADARAIKTLNDEVVKKANLVNGFTQTTAGQNALDAVAGKTLYDNFNARMTPAPNSNTDLSGYTDSSSPFVCPHDGYVGAYERGHSAQAETMSVRFSQVGQPCFTTLRQA